MLIVTSSHSRLKLETSKVIIYTSSYMTYMILLYLFIRDFSGNGVQHKSNAGGVLNYYLPMFHLKFH